MAEINDQIGTQAQAEQPVSRQVSGGNPDASCQPNAGDTPPVPEVIATVVDVTPAQVTQVETKVVTAEGGNKKPYSAFSTGQKWAIVAMVGLASLFSPISSNIYVPAIPTLVKAFDVSVEKINLTVTVFLIFQALTPSVWGTAADTFGRRPVYFMTLTIFALACLGTALCPTSDYWLLMLMRIAQASGGSATIAIGTGVIADIAMPHERGTFLGCFNVTGTFSMAIGPVLGGIFTGTLGWRSIFWFLVIACFVALVAIMIFLPETLRTLVGDGSLPPPLVNCNPRDLLRRHKQPPELVQQALELQQQRLKFQPWLSFVLLFQPDVCLLFVWTSLYYAEWYAVLTIFSTYLRDYYKFNDIQIGLSYIANGVGTGASGFICGRIMDRVYRKELARVGGNHRTHPEEFRLERTRFIFFPFQVVIFLTSCICFGWTIDAQVHVAAPIIFTFIIGIGVSYLTTTTIYGLDLFPGQGGAITAAFNLTRCLLGAAATSVVQLMTNAMGPGWTFVTLSGICLLATPMPLIVYKYAPGWRRVRREKALKAEEKHRRKLAEKRQRQVV